MGLTCMVNKQHKEAFGYTYTTMVICSFDYCFITTQVTATLLVNRNMIKHQLRLSHEASEGYTCFYAINGVGVLHHQY